MATLKLAWTKERRALEAFRTEAQAWSVQNTRIMPATGVAQHAQENGHHVVRIRGQVVAFMGEGEPGKPPISYGVHYYTAKRGDPSWGALAGQDGFGQSTSRTRRVAQLTPCWYDYDRPLYTRLAAAVQDAELRRLEAAL
jgi:hypothetical protein